MGLPLLVAAWACTSPDPTEAPVEPEPAMAELGGWVAEVGHHPASFAALIAAGKDGWVALHAHRYADAVQAFADQPVGRARAELELSALHSDLADLSGVVAEKLFTGWKARSGLPAGTDAQMVAALAAWCASGETATGWASQAGGGPDDAVAKAIAQGRSPFEVTAEGPFGRRIAIHQAARNASDPAPLIDASSVPVVERQADGFVRAFWDPCLHHTLADIWLDRAVRDANTGSMPGAASTITGAASAQVDGSRWRRLDRLTAPTAGLGGSLFAPWLTSEDLASELAVANEVRLVGAHQPSMRVLGLGTAVASTSDDPEAARAEIRLLDAGLDAIQREISDRGDPEGAAVVNDLGLVARFRQEWLLVRAREALADDHPRAAATLLEVGRDHAARTPGPENSPALFALVALARLRLGYTREALDALHALAAYHPEVKGLIEATGDLAVLEGIDRQGDSKEDQ